jgi:hypothetical protein
MFKGDHCARFVVDSASSTFSFWFEDGVGVIDIDPY